MAFREFVERIERSSEKISLFHAVLLSFAFTIASVIYHQGGALLPEMYVRLPYYLSDKPLLNKLFDSRVLDVYRARELSYLFDFLDCKFIEFSIKAGIPHFLSLTHYLFSIIISCVLWLFCVKQLKLKPLFGVGLLALYWTSSCVFLGGDMFRSAKIGVALLGAILFYISCKVTVLSKARNNFIISKRIWCIYWIAIVGITFFDEQGLFLVIASIVFWAVWALVFPHKNIYALLLIGIASLTIHVIYWYSIGPRLTYILNGYWPDMSYKQFPNDFISLLGPFFVAGVFLYIETFRFLMGSLPPLAGVLVILFFISFPIFYLYIRRELLPEEKKFFALVLFELLITNLFLVILMYGLMALTHRPLMWPGALILYYPLPISVILMMTLGIWITVFQNSLVPKWLVPLSLCLIVSLNILAFPQLKAVIIQWETPSYTQLTPSLLVVLKDPDAMNTPQKPIVEMNPVYQFFKSRK